MKLFKKSASAEGKISAGRKFKNKMKHIVWREKRAIKSSERLGCSFEVKNLTAKYMEDIEQHSQLEIARFEEMLAHAAKKIGISLPLQQEETKPEKEAKNLTPRRLFKGTFNVEALKEALGDKDYLFFEEIGKKDMDFRKKIYEIFLHDTIILLIDCFKYFQSFK